MKSNFNIYNDVLIKEELERIPWYKISAFISIVDGTILNLCEFTCTTMYNQRYYSRWWQEGTFDYVLQLWKDFSGANEGFGGFKDHKFWNWYPSFIQRRIRIKRLKKFREQLYLLYDENCGKVYNYV